MRADFDDNKETKDGVPMGIQEGPLAQTSSFKAILPCRKCGAGSRNPHEWERDCIYSCCLRHTVLSVLMAIGLAHSGVVRVG